MSWLTFWLRVDSGYATAVGAVFGARHVGPSEEVAAAHWVRFSPNGKVRAIRHLVGLGGAEAMDPDDFERELREATLPGVEGELQVLRFNPADFPRGAALGVDMKSGEVFATEQASYTQID